MSQFQFQFRFFINFNFRNFSHVHSMISPQILIQIQWFFILWIRSLSLLFKDTKFPNFLSTFNRLIWSNSERSSEIILIPGGFDYYSSLYPSIRDYFLKLVSLVLILTLDRVFSMTSRSQFVSEQDNCWSRFQRRRSRPWKLLSCHQESQRRLSSCIVEVSRGCYIVQMTCV